MNLLPCERAILGYPVEYAALVNAQGLLLCYIEGDTTAVYVPDTYRPAMRGGVYCHTHVTGDWMLSPSDVAFAASWDLYSIRVMSVHTGCLRGASLTRTGDHFPAIPHEAMIREWKRLAHHLPPDGAACHQALMRSLANRYRLVYEVYSE